MTINSKHSKTMAILDSSFIKKWIHIFILLLIISVSNLVFGQTNSIEILLNTQNGNGPFKGSTNKVTKLDPSTIAKNIPDFIEQYIIKHFGITTIKQEEMNFYFLIGKNISGDTILIYDRNNDFDFTNDTIYSSRNSTLKNNYTSINLNFLDSIPRFFKIRPIVNETNFRYFNRVEQENYLMISPNEHLKGTFFDNKNNYTVYVYPYNGTPDYKYNDGSKILLRNKDTIIELKIGEPQKIDSIVITPISISQYGEKLTLNIDKYEQAQYLFGNNSGFKFPKMYLTDIMYNKFAIPLKSKYTLLDFWGTWCGPCKELTPELKVISDNKNSKLEIISIATYEKERVNVLRYIKDNEMNWHHVILNDKNSTSITKLFKVNEFPTFILVNPDGIVVDRYIGPNGFIRLKIKLIELKLSK